jgi:hypothetical protein
VATSASGGKKMKLSRDQIVGALIVILGVFVFVMISSFKVPFTLAYPGPKALPGLAAIGFIICGAGIFVEGMKKTEEEKVYLVKAGWIRLGINLLALMAYVLAMKFVGYFIATPIFLYGLCTWYANGYETKLWQRILFAAAVTAVIYLVYVMAFGYQLPAGELFG